MAYFESDHWHPSVATDIVLLTLRNKKLSVLLVKRLDKDNGWALPGGFLKKGENLEECARRELKEETSIFNVKLIKEIEDWTQYDLPSKLIGIIWKGRYKGQKQKWFIFKFLGNDTEINIKTKNPEFLDWKWIEIGKITEIVVDFKKEVYQKVEKEIKKIIN